MKTYCRKARFVNVRRERDLISVHKVMKKMGTVERDDLLVWVAKEQVMEKVDEDKEPKGQQEN